MSLSTCTSACPRTCAEPEGPEECDMPCIEACVCPVGTLLDGTDCVQPESCGCFLESGEYVKQLHQWTSPDCTQQCYCEGQGELQCRNYTCNENADCVIDSESGRRTCQCHEGLHGNGEICVTDSGFCQVWGDPHYKTFDGRIYSFQGSCQYTLVKPCDADSSLPEFHLIGDNQRRRPSDRVSYARVLILRYRGHEYVLKRMFVSVDGVKVTLPLINHVGVTIHYDVPFTTLETDFGLKVRYNQRTDGDIFLVKDYASSVCGLCGNFDGNRRNEFTMPNGRRNGRARVFAKSWLVEGDPECGEEANRPDDDELEFEEDPCQFANSDVVQQAESLCQILSPQDDRLASCRLVADSTMYYETCRYDLCATLPEVDVLCDSVEEYVMACREAGGEPGNWREDVPQCPFECPSGFIYSHCGPACLNTCIERNRTALCEEHCQETCLCPAGQLLDGDRCVEETECGCLLENGRYISRGETWTSDTCSELCTCEGGHLQCDYIHCHENAQCIIENDERKCRCDGGYVSLGDSCIPETGVCIAWGHYHFLTYDGVALDWRGNCIYTFVKTCGDLAEGLKEFHLTGDFDPRTVTGRVTGLKRIRLHYNGHEYRIERDRVLLDGLEVTLPLRHGGIHIYLRPIYTIMETDFGLRVLYNQNAHYRMYLSSAYGGSVCGLCGNFDGYEENDFTMPDGLLATDAYEFGNSWAVEDCRVVTPMPDPCRTAPLLQQEASNQCIAALNSDDISICRDVADFRAFHEACTRDLCFSNLAVQDLCRSIEAYVALCQETVAIPSTWREDVTQCTFECPVGMIYTACGSGCPATCLEPNGPANCTDSCTEMCTCPHGQVLDGTRCVTLDECGCELSPGFYLANGQSQMDENCSQLCTCQDGVLGCYGYTCHEYAECDLRDGTRDCWCEEGYIGDGGHCRPATSVCRIWGDPHYITFDSRSHDFQGSCEYSLVETLDSLEGLPGFELYATNINKDPNSSSAYMRQLRLVYRGNEFILGPGSNVQLNGFDNFSLPLYDYEGVTIYYRFPDIVLETEFGLCLTFNMRSKVDITLSAEYGGQIGGLCGDFDENRYNDLRLPDGTLTRSVNKFGNSWATDVETCVPEEGVNPLSPCRADPYLMAQAQVLCGALSTQSDIFADCRGVGMEVFYEACLYDLCATNLSVAYMCESVQEYAAACEDAGGTLGDWKSALTQCADGCPEGMIYTDCGEACPETCANQRNNRRHCSNETCVETCVCPDGQLLDGLNCVPREECGCVVPSGVYISADSIYITLDCDQFCTCMDGELDCFEYSCDINAGCLTKDGFHGCHCNEGYIGNGETCMKAPGTGMSTNVASITIADCPSDINKTVPLCEGGVMVSWQPPTATSEEGAEVRPVQTSATPGTFYPPGVYNAYYQFEDDYNNTAGCNFTITVDAALVVQPGQCATPDGDVIEDGGGHTSSDCSQQCLCTAGVLVCHDITCSNFADCTVQGGERGCYCLVGYQGDGLTCDRSDCPSSFYAFGSSCYHFQEYGPRMSFDEARAYCQGMGADLPVIQDKAENDYLAEMNGEHYRAWVLAKRHPDSDFIMETTGPDLEYKFLADPLPEGFNFIEFSVKAGMEAHIVLSHQKNASGKVYEFVIGGDMNTRSYVALCSGCKRELNIPSEGILSAEEHRHFYISISGRAIYIGFIRDSGSSNAIFAYLDRQTPLVVKYVGFGTAGVKGEWTFYRTFSWLDGSDWAFENWRATHPKSTPETENCIQMGYGCSTHWVDVDCSEPRRVICEIPMEN